MNAHVFCEFLTRSLKIKKKKGGKSTEVLVCISQNCHYQDSMSMKGNQINTYQIKKKVHVQYSIISDILN